MTKITTDMIMGDIIRQYPQVVDTLVAQGMHCLGCPSSQQESPVSYTHLTLPTTPYV